MERALLLETSMITAKSVVQIALARAGIRPVPFAVVFEVTHLCNLACDYCDRHTRLPDELTLTQILTALDELVALGMAHISLDGGEPLAHPDIDAIVDALVSHGVSINMNTNGILVPRKLETIAKLKKVKISLDGDEAAHDAIRGRNAWRRAIKGAEAVREAGVDMEFTCVVGRHNAHGIDALIDDVEARDMRIVFQPARNSLFLDTERDGAGFQLDVDDTRRYYSGAS